VGLLGTTPQSTATGSAAQECFLVQNGQAKASIAVGRDTGLFHRWVAGEVQRYVKQLSGAELPVVSSERLPSGQATPAKEIILENGCLAASFDNRTGALQLLANKLTGEVYRVRDDAFRIDATDWQVDFHDAKLASLKTRPGALEMRYEHPRLRVEVTFTLGTEHHFIEKRLTLSGDQAYGLRRVIVSRPQFAADKLAIIVPYRYQHNVTYIGRTEVGGFFVGEEVPFDTSLLDGDSVTLSYRPGLKVKAGEEVQCEPAYFGVYRRSGRGARAKGLSISPSVEGDLLNGSYHHLPLAEETEAMVAMVSAILGPPRHGPTSVLSPLCCGGVPLGPMDEKWFESDQQRARIKQILDFAAECGIEWVQDYLPWGGEYNKVRRLAAGERREFNDWMRDLLAYTKRVGLKPIIWSTMTNVQPWSGPKTRPAFRPDKPEWRAVGPAAGKVDGSAHVVGERGFVFLFNPNSRTLPGQFALTEESIGLKGAGPFQLTQEYPEPGRTSIARSGDTVRWEVPAQSTVLLRIRKTEAK
jgi:hypothetical protein